MSLPASVFTADWGLQPVVALTMAMIKTAKRSAVVLIFILSSLGFI
jgi:hypothetical protein